MQAIKNKSTALISWPKAECRDRLRRRLIAIVSWLAVGVICQNAAVAQTVATESPDVDTAEEQRVVRSVSLDKFQIHDLRPVRNETVKMSFELHLVLAEDASDATYEHLALWKQRLRDRVIMAVRSAHAKELVEPSLARLRRRILLRVNRALKSQLIEEVLLTSFSLRRDY